MSSGQSTDVVIVGAGLMGCAIGLRLAQRRLAVTIIERGVPGAEASSAAAGILGAQIETDGPGPGFELSLRSRALYPALAAEMKDATGIDIGLVKSGILAVALDDHGEAELAKRRTWQLARGARMEVLAPDALAKLEPNLGPGIRTALRFPDDGQVSPRELVRALSQAAALAGARFVEGRYVRRVVVEAGAVSGVELDGETIAAGAVVIAAGSWSGLVEGAGLRPTQVRPVRGQVAAIETRPPLFRHVVYVPKRGYVVPRPDGTVIAGSTMEMAGFRKEVTVSGLGQILGLAQTLVPGLAEAPVTGSWANFRPFTEDGLPILGLTPVGGLALATGHSRNGVMLTPVTAQVIAELVATGASSIDLAPFSLSRFGA